MDLRMKAVVVAGLSAFVTVAALAGPAAAQSDAARDSRLIFVGADASEGRPGPVAGALSVLSLDTLPAADAADVAVLAALLRSNPVSTFVATPGSAQAQTSDLYLVTDIALAQGSSGVTAEIGGTALPLSDVGARLAALADAFGPDARQIGFFRMSDPEGLFPQALPDLRAAIDATDLAMSVLMIDADTATCDGAARPALHYATLGGVPDREPFGNGDGIATAAETVAWLDAALTRGAVRGDACAPAYNLILRESGDPDRALVTVPAAPLIPEMEQAVFMETFEALFLKSSDDADAIETYLASCTYCPSEAALRTRLDEIEQRLLALRLERQIWNSIAADTTPDRMRVYLDNCRLCAFEDDAQVRIATLVAADEARAGENAARDTAIAARDLPGLRAWLEDCIACDDADMVAARIDDLVADSRYQAELASLDTAIDTRDPRRIAAWIDDCELCDGLPRAEEALQSLADEAAAAAPCLALAGLPQQGGPRLLSGIDTAAATATCQAVLADHPDSALVRTILGRVALATGDGDTARAAYETGIAAGLAQAYGLAAHAAYAPTGGVAPDYAAAADLAQRGYDMGDWLSGEVLTVLYSRELIEGRVAADAFAIALDQAEEGNPVAQFFAGYFLRTGTGTEPDDVAAARWLTAAVDQGYLHAASFLAEIYEEGGQGVDADPDRAADLYFTALDGGDPTALDRLTNQVEDRPGDVVRLIQERLRDAGVFDTRIDGIPGPATARAIDAYSATIREEG